MSATIEIETFLKSLPRNGIDNEINNEARVQYPADLPLVVPLRFSPQDVNEFMFSLPRARINNDLDEYSICKEAFNKPRANSMISETLGGASLLNEESLTEPET